VTVVMPMCSVKFWVPVHRFDSVTVLEESPIRLSLTSARHHGRWDLNFDNVIGVVGMSFGCLSKFVCFASALLCVMIMIIVPCASMAMERALFQIQLILKRLLGTFGSSR